MSADTASDLQALKFEERCARWVIAVRWPVIAVSTILVLLAGSGCLFLSFSTDYRIFFSEDNPELLAYEALESTYGKTDNVLFMIVPDGGDATSEQALEALVWLTERAWQTPYSRRVDSMANFQRITADGDELSVRDLVDPVLLGQEQERIRIRDIALADLGLAGSLVARDGSVSAVNVTVELVEEDQAVRVPEIVAFAGGVVTEAEERFPGIGFRVVGTVIINHAFSEASVYDHKVFLPASLAVMVVILGLLTRNVAGVGTTVLVVVFSVIVSMGLGGWTGLSLSPTVTPAPSIVLMIVVANCVHLLVALRRRLRAGDARRAAIIEAVRINLQPIFLTNLTTALGFLSLNFAEVPPHRDLGNFVAFGIGAAFLLSIAFLPALLSLLPVRRTPAVAPEHDGRAMTAIAEFVVGRRKILMWGSAVVVLALLAAVPRNELNDVLVHSFDESTQLRKDTDFLDERLSGTTQLEYSLAAGRPGDVTDPVFLTEVAAFADWYREQPETRHVEVITDTFRQLNKSMHGDDPDAYRLPADRELAAQYLLLYEFSLPRGRDLNNRIDLTRSATRMTVTTRTLSSKGVIELNGRAEAWLQANASRIVHVDSSGPALLFAHIGQRSIRAMLTGTSIALLGISIVLLFALRSFRLGIVSLVPNFVPAVLGFGVWGLLVGQVGLALSVVVAITIGIVVDDTVHFLSKYQRARREHTAEDAVRYAFRTVGQALVTTTIIFVAGFLILLLSPFIPTAQVGLLIAMIIGFALLADLTLLPSLLMAVDRGEA